MEARYSFVFFEAEIIYSAIGGAPIENKDNPVPASVPNNNPILNVGLIFIFLLKKIKYKPRSIRNKPSIFFIKMLAYPLQKIIISVIAVKLPINNGIIIFRLVCLYSFIAIKTQITSVERVDITNESEYE